MHSKRKLTSILITAAVSICISACTGNTNLSNLQEQLNEKYNDTSTASDQPPDNPEMTLLP